MRNTDTEKKFLKMALSMKVSLKTTLNKVRESSSMPPTNTKGNSNKTKCTDKERMNTKQAQTNILTKVSGKTAKCTAKEKLYSKMGLRMMEISGTTSSTGWANILILKKTDCHRPDFGMVNGKKERKMAPENTRRLRARF
jgi:hypothetical protein